MPLCFSKRPRVPVLVALCLCWATPACDSDEGSARKETASKQKASPTPGQAREPANQKEGSGAEARAADESGADGETAAGLFYEVDGDRGQGHLLGSIHVGDQSIYPLRSAIRKAFRNADALAVEVKMDRATMQEAAQKMATSAKYPPGKSLADAVSADTMKLLKKRSKQAGAMHSMLTGFEPWFVSMTLTSQAFKKHGLSPQQGIDLHFQKKAIQSQKEIVSLESVEEQVSLFNSLDEQTQELMLRDTLADLPQMGQIIEQLISAWKKGDAEAFEEVTFDFKDKEGFDPLFHNFFLKRNRKMAKKIDKHLRSGTKLFVVVGGAHMVGEKSIPALLEDKGYDVAQSSHP